MDFNQLEESDRMKYEIAEELGLLEKVQKGGWKSLSSRETGKIGGILSTRRRAQAKKENRSRCNTCSGRNSIEIPFDQMRIGD